MSIRHLVPLQIRRIFFGSAFGCLLSTGISAQSFTPVQDVRTDFRTRLVNYESGDLGVDRGLTSASFDFERSYLRFVVSGIAPQNIDCVTLLLTESNSTGNTHFEVRIPQSPWSEIGMTWNSQPNPIGPRIGAWVGSSVANDETIQIPLNPAFFAGGDGTYELMLVESDTGRDSGIRFSPREGSSPPRLVFGCAGMGARAGFSARRRDGAVPFTPQFLPFLPADTSSVLWDFGDGNSSTSFEPNHTYTSPGRYQVTLTATNPAGTVSVTRKDYLLAYPEDAAAGSVLSSTKISATTQGGSAIGLADGDMFGRSVGAIGDLNGDGNTDIIVGAVGDDTAGNNAGAVHILALDAAGAIKGSIKISEGLAGFTGDLDAGDGFGREVAPIGDWDNDGVLDVAVGANRDDDDGSNAGAVWMLFLNSNGTVKSHAKINATNGAPIGFNPGDEFGRGIARLEDMDGDGVPELAVGSIYNRDSGNRFGCVWILFMRNDGSVKSAKKISPNVDGFNFPFVTNSSGHIWFGMSVSPLGDVDGNGVTDIVVGALLDSGDRYASGSAVIVLLNADGSVKDNHFVNADTGILSNGEITSNDELGGSSAGIGDLDGDGIPDLALGSIRDDDNTAGNTDYFGDYGAIYICFLNADGSIRDYQKISATRGGLSEQVNITDRIGEGLAGIGDFNGDGIVDLLVGSRFNDAGGPNWGAAYIFELNNGLGGVAPVAAFEANPTSGVEPLEVSFNDLTTGVASSWLWDFGDGNSSSLRSPTHAYTSAGTYDVTLTVSGFLGADSVIQAGLVDVAPAGSNITLYGSGVNPAGSMQLLGGDGSLGSTITFGIDNPLGTQAVGSRPFLTLTRFPAPGFPSGILRPGLGMNGGPGELLIALSPPPILAIAGNLWSGPGNPVPMSINIPNNPALAGLTIYAQGRLMDTSPGAAIPLGLTNALAITLIP